MRLVFATTNKGKLEELRGLVQGLPLQVLSLAEVEHEEVEEDRPTLAGNAIKKALACRDRTGLPALADDTGLCVEALDGAPGVHSARYGGVQDEGPLGDSSRRYRANNERLLRELADVPLERRGAEFCCALCLALPGEEPLVVEGRCPGRIALGHRGGKGFGYDSLFEVPELGRTTRSWDPRRRTGSPTGRERSRRCARTSSGLQRVGGTLKWCRFVGA